MNELPLVALVVVLKQLPYPDLVRCRSVSKLWRHLIDHSVDKQELILFVETHRRPLWWEHNGKQINLQNSLQANFSVFESKPFFTLFKWVKRLFLSFNYFYFSQHWTNNLAMNLGSLQNLQIDYQVPISLSESGLTKFRLALQNLKTFCFSPFLFPKEQMERLFEFWLDCDRLTHLYTKTDFIFESNSMIDQVAPNLRVFFAGQIDYKEPLNFPNLETLGACNAPDTQFLVQNFPSLKEFYFAITFTLASTETEANDSIREFLVNIEMAKREVNVYWQGMKFTRENLDRNIQALVRTTNGGTEPIAILFTDKSLNYFKANPSILDFKHLAYSGDHTACLTESFEVQLDEHVDPDLIKGLREKFYSVYINDLNRQLDVPKLGNLFQFVSILRVLGDPSHKQTAYNTLPAIFPNVRMLGLFSVEWVDLSFVSEFKHLYSLNLKKPLSWTVLDRIITNCPFLFVVYYRQKEKQIYVNRIYKYIEAPERRFQLRFPTGLSSETLFFKEKSQLLECMLKNGLLL